MSDIILTLEIAEELYNSGEQFPVDLDIAWRWLGYTRKEHAKSTLVSRFKLNIDYTVTPRTVTCDFNSYTATEKIFLSVECLKILGMMVNTSKGNEVRQYFLQCERIAKEFMNQNRDIVKAVSICNSLVENYKQLQALSDFYASKFLTEIGVKNDETKLLTTEQDLNASLVANRLGLAFNKHLKAFETLQDATSPNAFNRLKEEYSKLMDDYIKLFQLKTPKEIPVEVENTEKLKKLKEHVDILLVYANRFLNEKEALLKVNAELLDKIEALESQPSTIDALLKVNAELLDKVEALKSQLAAKQQSRVENTKTVVATESKSLETKDNKLFFLPQGK